MSNIESEKKLERSLKKFVETEKKGLCVKLLSQHFSGLPDRICLMPQGIIFFAEIKTTGKDLEPRQKIVRQLLRNFGFEVFKVDTTEDIKKIRIKYEATN